MEKKSLINIKSSDIIKRDNRIPIKDANFIITLSEDKDTTKLDYFEHLTLGQNKCQRRIIKFLKENFNSWKYQEETIKNLNDFIKKENSNSNLYKI